MKICLQALSSSYLSHSFSKSLLLTLLFLINIIIFIFLYISPGESLSLFIYLGESRSLSVSLCLSLCLSLSLYLSLCLSLPVSLSLYLSLCYSTSLSLSLCLSLSLSLSGFVSSGADYIFRGGGQNYFQQRQNNFCSYFLFLFLSLGHNTQERKLNISLQLKREYYWLLPPMPHMRAYIIRGRNIFQISSGTYLKGHMPLIPHGWTRLWSLSLSLSVYLILFIKSNCAHPIYHSYFKY